MKIEGFADELAKKIEEYTKREVQIYSALKNNGKKMTGLVIKGESNVSPTIYLECFFDRYQKGEIQIEEIIDEILEIFETHAIEMDFDIDAFKDFESIKSNIKARLVNTEMNREILKNSPHREILDLSIVYVVDVRVSDALGSIRVLNSHMESWDVTEADLYSEAMKNIRDETTFLRLVDVLKSFMDQEVEISLPDDEKDMLYILSNENRMYGAIQLMNKRGLEDIKNKIGEFVVLPSSLHELILIPVKEDTDFKALAEMVSEVNNTQVAEEEILSYHVYRYCDNQLEIAA